MPTLSDYTALADARTPEELSSALQSVASKLGFPLFSGVLVVDRFDHTQAIVPLHNTPAAFLAKAQDPSASKRDPVVGLLRDTTIPFFWNQDTYARGNAGDLWEEQAPFGYRNGVAVRLQLEGRRRFILGVDTPEKLPTNERRLVRLLADIQFLAVNAQTSALRLLEPLVAPTTLRGLTERELEVLTWTMLGKDAQAIADIVGVTVRTVQFHVNNAIAKLGTDNKHAAVLLALEYGLIRRN